MALQRLTAIAVAILLVGAPALGSAQVDDLHTLSRLSLEELLQQDVTSVMRKEQPLARAPSAVYVLTGHDIRRSGATTIQEALRLVPGVTVVRTNANSWIVTARGFDSKGATKLLVLIDGRSVYSPFFSGVFWDIQDVVLADIDRIEVIRGPGAVHWGENAVNGVINIITKKSTDTQGLLAEAGGGTEEQAFGALRYGGKFSEDSTYRMYGKAFRRDSSVLESGGDAEDDWDGIRGGFRVDSGRERDGLLTVQGDIYDHDASQPSRQFQSFSPPFTGVVRNETDSHGGNFLVRYSEELSDTSRFSIQSYYDRTSRRDLVSGEHRNTFDLDAQHQLRISESHDLVYGANYRTSRDRMDESIAAEWSPEERTTHLFSAFIQDEILLIPERFSLIPGTKLGYNTQSGFEYQPALKTVWSPSSARAVWASVSRAVRMPSRFDEDLRFAAGGTVTETGDVIIPTIFGNKSFESEKLYAYEAGYRAEPERAFSYDIAAFYHRYNDLFSLEQGTPFVETVGDKARIILPFVADNRVNGDVYGIEVASTWRPIATASIVGTYSYIHLNFDHDSGSSDTLGISAERRTPHHQATLRLHFDLPANLEFDTLLYYVDSIPMFDVPSYVRTDVRLGWNVTDDLALEIIGQDIFDRSRQESSTDPRTEIERAVFGRVTVQL